MLLIEEIIRFKNEFVRIRVRNAYWTDERHTRHRGPSHPTLETYDPP
jgi:hypothetical protein